MSNRRFKKLSDELEETKANCIEVTEEYEQHAFLMESIDYITLSLLGMPDDNLELFDSYLLSGMHSVSVSGELDAIKVFRNRTRKDHEQQFVKHLSWDGENSAFADKNEYSYAMIPGWYEKLKALEIINMPVSELSEAERAFIGDKAKSFLLIPVYFQEHFWGTVLYEDYSKAEPFNSKRVSFLRSAALMTVSALHRKWQATRIVEDARRNKIMIDAMPVCCYIWDKTDGFIDLNVMGLQLFNFKSKDDLNKRFWAASPEFQPDGRRSSEAGLAKLMYALNEGECSFEWMHCIPGTRELVPAEVILIRMFYEGRYVVIGYVRDIREHKNMMSEIENRENLLYTVNAAATTLLQSESDIFDAALFRALNMMAKAVDVKRVFVWEYAQDDEDHRFNQIYKWQGEADGFKRLDIPIDYTFDTSGFESRLLRGQSLMGFSRELPKNARTAFDLDGTNNYHIIPIFMQGKLWGLIGFADIRKMRGFAESEEAILRSGGLLIANALYRNEMTKNIKINAIKLSQALDEAQSASKAKSNFLSTMSHEIRTPLNAIIGMSNIGRGAHTIERKDYAFDKLTVASKHLLGIINDILDMSKIEAGMFTFSYEPFELNQTLDEILTVNQYRFDEKNQKFTMETDTAIPKIIITDNQRLAQVIINLLSNAGKFTAENKKIELKIKSESITDKHCILKFSVSDEGIGLTQEQQKGLFKPFFQAEEDTTRKFGGTGLGLTISKHIVEQMGGEMWVESEPGEGSVFSFTINAGLPTAQTLISESETETAEVLILKGKRLLLAEDLEINREIVQVVLEESQIEIVCAENGAEAVKLFSETPESFDIIFMDVHMPEMDGFTATEKIRALDTPYAENVPIIAMTANVFREDVEKCLKSGMNAHIGKPVDFKAMYKVLKKYL